MVLLLASCTSEKVAYVEMDEIYKEYDKAKEAEAEMSAKSQQMSAEMEQMRISFQQKVQVYQESSASLSAADKQTKEQELMREQQEIQQRQQMARQMIQDESQVVMDELNEDLETFIADYAKSKGISLVLGSSSQTKAVLYADGSKNITEDVIASLNSTSEPKEKVKEAIEEEESKTEVTN